MVPTTESTARTRSAHAAIRGYEYQFDRTVIELLDASSTAVINIEGIEDIDLVEPDVSQATQVKYYESRRYTSPKSLRDPMTLMLDHYRTGVRWSYVLHVHFGDPGELPTRFTLEQMKECLTRASRKPTGNMVVEFFDGLDDDALQDFCDRVSIRSGKSFNDQEDELVAALSAALRCNDEETLAIYLAKAREFVHERARKPDDASRQTSRAELLSFLNVKELLFSRWQLEELGRKRYLKAQVAHLKRHGFDDKKRVRGIAVELTDDNFVSVLDLTRSAANAHIGRLKSAKPWVIILGGRPELALKFKTELIRSGVPFNDGYESIEFSADLFSKPPVVNVVGASDKLRSSSYHLRVVSDTNFREKAITTSRLGRLIVVGDKADWHDAAADDLYCLKEYEPGLLQAVMGEIA